MARKADHGIEVGFNVGEGLTGILESHGASESPSYLIVNFNLKMICAQAIYANAGTRALSNHPVPEATASPWNTAHTKIHRLGRWTHSLKRLKTCRSHLILQFRSWMLTDVIMFCQPPYAVVLKTTFTSVSSIGSWR